MKKMILIIKKIISNDWCSAIIKDLRLEIIGIMAMIIFLIISYKLKLNLSSLKEYVNQDRIESTRDFLSIIIGVYMAIISILATSSTIASRKISAMNLDKNLICVIGAGTIENLVLILLSIFMPQNTQYYVSFLFLLFISMLSMIKFFVVVLRIFEINISNLASESSKKEKFEDDIITHLEQISRNIKTNK